MKTLLATIITAAIAIPSISFAQEIATPTLTNPVGSAVPTIATPSSQENERPMHIKKKHKKCDGKKKDKMRDMTQEEKEVFINSKIEKMERDLNELKGLDLEGQEKWFKEHKKMKNHKGHKSHKAKEHKEMKNNKDYKEFQKFQDFQDFQDFKEFKGMKRDHHKEMKGEHHKGKKDHKKEMRDLEKMSDEQKVVFFDKKVEQMERHLNKVDDPKMKSHMAAGLEEFKSLPLEEKEGWLKENHKKMKKNKEHMRKMCDKVKNGTDKKMPSDREAINRLINSEHFKNAPKEEQQKMMERYNEIKNKSPEEKQKMFEERKAQIEKKCKGMKERKRG